MGMLKNKKHELFCSIYAKTGKPKDSYIEAGYSEQGADQSASRLLKKAEIAARIAELRSASVEAAIQKVAIDKAWIMQELVDVVRMGKATEPVLDREGNETGELKAANLAAANKALELLGKEIGMFVDRKEIKTGKLDELPADDLKALDEILGRLAAAPQPAGAGSTRH